MVKGSSSGEGKRDREGKRGKSGVGSSFWGKNDELTPDFFFISFPLFLLSSMQALGNVREGSGEEVRSPGRPVILRPETLGKDLLITSASGHAMERLARTPQGSFVYNQAATTGLYHARWEPSGLLPFAVNLFDFRESSLAPRGLVPDGVPESQAEAYKIKIGYNPVAGTQQTQEKQQDWWKWFACRGTRGTARGVVHLQQESLYLSVYRSQATIARATQPTGLRRVGQRRTRRDPPDFS